jgi:UDP-GlcNAc3NAcA epimerase
MSYLHTDQHYDSVLSSVFLEELEISKPDYNLGVGSGTHGHEIDRSMPEEINRIVIDHCSDLVFYPMKISLNNLRNERIGHAVHRVGNYMVDILL